MTQLTFHRTLPIGLSAERSPKPGGDSTWGRLCWWLEVLCELVRLHPKADAISSSRSVVSCRRTASLVSSSAALHSSSWTGKANTGGPSLRVACFVFTARRRHKVRLSNAFYSSWRYTPECGRIFRAVRLAHDAFSLCPEWMAACNLPLPGAEDSCLIFRDSAGQHRYALPTSSSWEWRKNFTPSFCSFCPPRCQPRSPGRPAILALVKVAPGALRSAAELKFVARMRLAIVAWAPSLLRASWNQFRMRILDPHAS